MKKIIILIIAASFVLILTACGTAKTTKDTGITKTIDCTLNETGEDGLTVDYSIDYSFKGDTISKIESSSIIEVDPKMLEATLEGSEEIIKNMALYDGFTYDLTKEDDSHIKGEIEIDYSKINVEDLKKEYGDDYVKKDMYLNYAGMSFDTIKDSMVKAGYTCK